MQTVHPASYVSSLSDKLPSRSPVRRSGSNAHLRKDCWLGLNSTYSKRSFNNSGQLSAKRRTKPIQAKLEPPFRLFGLVQQSLKALMDENRFLACQNSKYSAIRIERAREARTIDVDGAVTSV